MKKQSFGNVSLITLINHKIDKHKKSVICNWSELLDGCSLLTAKKINKHMVVNIYCESSCKWLSCVETNSAIFNMLRIHSYLIISTSSLLQVIFQLMCLTKTWCLAYAKEVNLTWHKENEALTVIIGKNNSFINKLNPLLCNKWNLQTT